MTLKFEIGDIIYDPMNEDTYLIEAIKPHSLGAYYCWRRLNADMTGYFESHLIDTYGEFIKVG